MDVFDDLLHGVRGQGAVFGRSVLWPPWALRFADGADLTLCAPLRGEGWIVPGGGARARRVRLGETAIVRGPDPFVFTDDPDRAGTPVREAAPVGGGDAPPAAPAELSGSTVLLVASYRVPEPVRRRLVRALPPALVVPDEHDCSALAPYLEAQIGAPRPGRQIVLDRLLDWLLVCTLRDWFDLPEARPPAWYRALTDDAVGPALRAMHAAPARTWTTADLAAEAGVSRTTFAKRFRELMGEPPAGYLTEWRMDLAAGLLAEPGVTVAAVARRVGYADPFGFSAAFKRVRGVSPSAYRAALAGAADERRETPVG
ncbi:AraC family transcriptional regulator [Streptomonospora sp. S1-112]|uniref:AraC family transcriptional regulator n=1 Tax=Streptomonospora mangrovi TaxID=2883123 RepID=A0A9X3SGN3_9ACTN|nr:AraC family transcriptional regulator [Streptomonospora mangrovi]MDA0564359.1 AraC family transcriptional regulator [Streptomonospora mangrovi]